MAIVKVDTDDIFKNPHCVHGPTLKFSRKVNDEIVTFFACSAYRDRKDCSFYLLEDEKFTESKKSRWDEMKSALIEKYDEDKLNDILKNVLKFPTKDRQFCIDCNLLFTNKFLNEHRNHSLFKGSITHELLKTPTRILLPVQLDKKEAQYWFTNDSINTIISYLKKLNVEGVLCVGSPTIHENCHLHKLKSVLLDIDPRYYSFYSNNEFIWFNMFNFHFMKDSFKGLSVIKSLFSKGLTAVVIDPPFGARYEGLGYTLNKLSELNESSNLELIYLLILPYYMEPRVEEMNLKLKKLEVSINYSNHRFKRHKSPVCLFTNADQSLFPVDNCDKFKFCIECNRVRRCDSFHCFKCDECHRRDFKRCDVCSRCVKPSFYHCKKCALCVNQNHVCSTKRLLNGIDCKTKNKRNKCKKK